MKKLLLGIAVLALAAGPAFAITPGHLSTPTSKGDGLESTNNTIPRPEPQPLGVPGAPNDETPTRPVPEPGTMALTSLGLLALGAAARKRRGN